MKPQSKDKISEEDDREIQTSMVGAGTEKATMGKQGLGQ